jgi:Protein of unknown function (DUF1615)
MRILARARRSRDRRLRFDILRSSIQYRLYREEGLAQIRSRSGRERLVELFGLTVPVRSVFVSVMAAGTLLSGCASERAADNTPPLDPQQARALIDESLPPGVSDRTSWVADIYEGFTVQGLVPTRPNVCAVVAVIEQESSFRVNPPVPRLGAIAWKEIDSRAERVGVPAVLVHSALALHSSNGRTYSERIDAARTEKDLSDIYEDFVGSVPLGKRVFAEWNPVRTRGPMQVNIAFAEAYASVRPYPYPVKSSIADEVFTRRGSLYFGIAHLFAYQPPYDAYLYRFADFNAGQYASRNAAFQSAVSRASGTDVVTDGALLPHDGGAHGPGGTELALRTLAGRLDMSQDAIHGALEQGKTRDFERTQLYERVFALADRAAKRRLPRAIVPTIKLHGPKISRSLTTGWYAQRVNGRFQQCLGKVR